MKLLKLITAFLIPFTFHFTSSAQSSSTFTHYDSLKGNLSPLRECFDVYFYDLNLDINVDEKRISGNNIIYYLVKNDFHTIQIDLYANLKISSIKHHGKELKFERDSNAIFIHFTEPQLKNTKDYISIEYSGVPEVAKNPPWRGGVVWAIDSLDRKWAGIACEEEGASLWWPCKDHPSDEPDSMRMSFSVPSDLICISNGNLRSKIVQEDKTSFEWFVQYPINLYNVTFNIGHYAHFSDNYQSNKGEVFSLDYYVLDYNLNKAKNHFIKVKDMLVCYEKLFGIYPFPNDGYALVETPYWGMEHQSAIAYGNQYRTDMLDFDYIIVHESAHEWWGNSVSAKDHGELWIHESFATYSEALLVECAYNYESYLEYLNYQKKAIKNEQPILGPLNVNYNLWKDSDMYYKGTWMLHTLRSVINNDKLWFEIIYGLARNFKNSIVTTEDIIKYINNICGQDLHYFFDQYLKYPKPPKFIYSLRKKGGHTIINYKWNSDVKAFSMPVSATINKTQILKLTPNNDFQSYKFNGKINDIKINEELFYITSEKINP